MKLPMAEFYITNRCNLDCAYCNRLNNYNFKGHYELDAYRELYTQWSKIIQFQKLSILGGEPLLHKDLFNWILFLNKTWPKSEIEIVTNGTILNKVKGLYNCITSLDTTVLLDINVHNFSQLDKINDNVREFLCDDFDRNPTDNHSYDNLYTHKNLEVTVRKATAQHAAVIKKTDNGLSVHNSDVNKAHDVCTMKYCHHFVDGKLYKCGIPVVVKEFAKQHKVNFTKDQIEILKTNVGLSVDDVKSMDQNKLNDTLRQPISFCNFCPEEITYNEIEAKSGYTKIGVKTI